MSNSKKRRDAERRRAAARKAEEMREAQAAAERRRRALFISLAVIAAFAVVIAVAVFVQNDRTEPSAPASAVAGTTPDYGVLVGVRTAPVKLVVYEDFMCPFCKQFEDAGAETLTRYVADETISIEYRPVAILDDLSSTEYSTRSLNAAACVIAEAGSAAFVKFHDFLYANQPAEGSVGLSDGQLEQYAASSGADGPAVRLCITDQANRDWTVGAADAFAKAGLRGTPTVLINGAPFGEIQDSAALEAAIQDAAAAG